MAGLVSLPASSFALLASLEKLGEHFYKYSSAVAILFLCLTCIHRSLHVFSLFVLKEIDFRQQPCLMFGLPGLLLWMAASRQRCPRLGNNLCVGLHDFECVL